MNWQSVFTTTGISAALLAASLWLLRNWISARLLGSIRHEYNKDLEALRTELRNTEAKFKADLDAREAELAALRSGALANITIRHTAVAQRRIEAVDRIWETTVEGAKFRLLLLYVQIFNQPSLREAFKKDQVEAERVFDMLRKPIPKIDNFADEAAKQRPYVSRLAWAYFEAYKSIILMAHGTFLILSKGENPSDFFSEDSLIALLKFSLPDWDDKIIESGLMAGPQLAEELLQRLLTELQNVLDGKKEDQAEIERAAEILTAAKKVYKDKASADELKSSIC